MFDLSCDNCLYIMHKQMILKYCNALGIKDFNNLTKEEKIK